MAYQVDGYQGVAWYRARKSRDGRAFMTMVGDDRVFEFDCGDVHRIKDDQYCSICGQIGCQHEA